MLMTDWGQAYSNDRQRYSCNLFWETEIGVKEKTKGRRTIDNASLDVCPYTLFLQSEVGLLRFYLLQQTVALIF